MRPEYITTGALKRFIKSALKEDIGDGDHSSLATIPEQYQSEALLIAKDQGMLAGIELSKIIFHHYDPSLTVHCHKQDGEGVMMGDQVLTVSGNARSILATERLILNCLQRMSGIATKTQGLVRLIETTQAKLLDTRKTTPNFRLIEKWAVSIGGGTNHRFGLYDLIMLKDNHIDFAGGVKKAIEAAKAYLERTGKNLKIEVETRNLQEVNEVVRTGGVDIIMLDNMMPSTMREAIRIIDGQFKTEASGGITEKNILEVAECGVDFISIGALTHSVNALDMSLKAKSS